MDFQPATDDRSLLEQIASTTSLLTAFSDASPAIPQSSTQNPATAQTLANPLFVLRDSAKLIKAHTTKLSLLSINKPFTPSAISKVLRQVAETCLAASTSCLQIGDEGASKHGRVMCTEVQMRTRRVFRELNMLFTELKAIANGSDPGRKDSLAATGVVWEACDAVVELEQLGIAGLAVQKAEQYRDTIKDAIAELREWIDGDDPENEGLSDQLLDSDDEGVAGDTDSVEDLFNAANSMPKDRPTLRELAELAESKMKKIVLLHTALIKRRLKTFKTGDGNGEPRRLEVLDEVLRNLRRIPPDIDEMVAEGFYNLDEEGARSKLECIVKIARGMTEAVELDWEQKEDEFTAWSRRWKEAMAERR